MMITLSTVRYLCGWAAASFSSLFFLAAAAAAGSAGPFDRYQTAPPAMAAPNTATAAMMMTNFIFFIYALLPLGLHGKGGAGLLVVRQGAARSLVLLAALLVAAAAVAVGEGLGAARRGCDRHVDVAELTLRQVLAHAVAVAGRQIHLQRAVGVADGDVDAAHVLRFEADGGLVVVVLQLQLQTVAQRVAQRLLPLLRRAGQRDGIGGAARRRRWRVAGAGGVAGRRVAAGLCAGVIFARTGGGRGRRVGCGGVAAGVVVAVGIVAVAVIAAIIAVAGMGIVLRRRGGWGWRGRGGRRAGRCGGVAADLGLGRGGDDIGGLGVAIARCAGRAGGAGAGVAVNGWRAWCCRCRSDRCRRCRSERRRR